MDEEIYKMDKSIISSVNINKDTDEKKFWLSKTPQERIMSMEYVRQVLYGYNPSSDRLHRVLEVIESA